MKFKLGELFCGPGGIALGAHLAKVDNCFIDTVWANDYDKDTCITYKNNIGKFSNLDIIHEDVRKLNIDKLKSIDCLTFGFPCNDFSVVGEQKGMDGVYGPLYSYGVKVINKFKPKWFLAENVNGLRNANEGQSFNKILNELYEEGYDLIPHLYKFEQYGVPQARHRIIIIGIRRDLGVIFRVPKPTHEKPITCKKAIENPPIGEKALNHVYTKQSEQVIERLKYIKPGENAFTADIPKDLQLNVKGAKISQIYKRLDPSKPSYTITGSGGGGTHVYHWKENRALTNRERARLQTFPDDFEFFGSKESIRKQIGMAVPPMGAKLIIEAVMKSFNNIKYESVPSSFKPMFHKNYMEVEFHNLYNDQLRVLNKSKVKYE